MHATRPAYRLGLLLALLLAIRSASAQEAGKAPARQGNGWGVNLGWEPGWDTTGTVRLLGLARNLVGDWGYIRHGIAAGTDIENIRRSMAMIRAHHLIPIVGGAYPDKEFLEPGKAYPRLDADGSMRTAALAKARVWKALHEAGIPFYVVEVMNEINIGDGWPAEKYAQWLYDYTIESKKAYPGLKICSCGMAGSGAEYYDKMLAHKPELKKVVDFWGLHPYGANHPPEYRPEGVSLRCYEETEAVLRKHGVSPIRLMCTETGYELEVGDTGKDPSYPPINEENRAEYMARAFRDYYIPRPTIECVAVFQLWDLPWHNWNGWDLMYHDGTPRPMYTAMAAEPKKPGRDWMPTGPARITGQVTWSKSGIGIPRVVVYTEPGLYGAVTDDQGRFEMTDLPEGGYRVVAFRDGYASPQPRQIRVSAGRPGKFVTTMERVSLVPVDFGPAGRIAASGTAGMELYGQQSRPEAFAVDPLVVFQGRNSQRITGIRDGTNGLLRYGEYSSAYPGEIFVAEAMVRSQKSVAEPDGTPWLELALTNGRGEVISVAKAFPVDFKPDGKWHRITAAVFGPARTSRARVAYGVDNANGPFWFSEPFVGEADFPLPGDAAYKTCGYQPPRYEMNKAFFAQANPDISERNPGLRTATITGQVRDFRGRPLPDATVATDTPLFVALTDQDGRYSLTVPAGPRVRLRAFALGETPAVSEPLTLKADESAGLDLQTAAPPASPALVNGDFEQYHEKEAGLMTGWTGFGTTDGILEGGKGKIIFDPSAYEGNGLFFAQSGSNTKNGGAWQMIQAEPGRKYRLSGYVNTRTEGGGKKPLDNNGRLGIDPTGGRDPESKDVVWTTPTESEQKWTPISVEALAKTTRITVFVRHEMRRANTWNLILFDAVKLEKSGR